MRLAVHMLNLGPGTAVAAVRLTAVYGFDRLLVLSVAVAVAVAPFVRVFPVCLKLSAESHVLSDD